MTADGLNFNYNAGMEANKNKRKSRRSANGCWTCRLRRKKCDEKHPSCEICLSHSLVCDGYDAKPAVMDGGAQEAAYAERLKEAVHRSMSMRKRRRSQKSYSVSSINQTPNEFNLDMNTYFETENMTAIWDPAVIEDPRYTKATNGDLYPMDVLTGSILPQSLTSPSSGPTVTPSQLGEALGATTREQNSTLDVSSQISQGQNWCRSDVLLYYLDHGFNSQFGVNTEALLEQRAFIFDLLLYSTPLRIATTALGYLQKIIETPGRNLKNTPLYEASSSYYSETLQVVNCSFHLDWQNLTVDVSSSSTVTLFSCLLQILYIEHYRDDFQAWSTTLGAVSTILSQQLDRTPDHLPGTSGRLQSALQSATNEIYCNNSSENMSFMVSTFLFFDIISSASLNTSPSLQNHKPLVTCHARMIETVSGCDPDVLLAILDITKLALWKKSMLECRKLDIMELALQASTIKNRLLDSLIKGEGSSSRYLTPVYTHAALIYLLISMSGAHTTLPGLQDHISAILSLISEGITLSTVGTKAYLTGIIWPLTMAGSMADLKHRQSLRHLMSTIDNTVCKQNLPLTSLGKAHAIMEHCWETRDFNPDHEIGWLNAMNNLGLTTVLL